MARFTDRIGTSLSEATSETEITGSPYNPLVNGRLVEVILTVCGSAATALWNNGYVRLASPSFGGVDQYAPFTGQGIKTAPAVNPHGIVVLKCDLAVKTGVSIKVYVKHETADTPITFELQVFGTFEG